VRAPWLRATDPHPAAWWGWALGVAAAVSATTNPVLIGLAVAAVCLVVAARRSDAPWALSFRLYLVVAGVVVLLRVAFRVVFGSAYVSPGDQVVLDLPSVPLPDWTAGLSLLGPVTAESLQAGFSDGLRLAALIVCVGAANTLADPRRLLASLPAALYEVGAAAVIALSMFPQLAESVQRVRHARMLRGDPGRGVSALRRVLVPVLEDAFERSLHLAASMDARGYGRTGEQSPSARRVSGTFLVLGLVGLCVGSYGLLDSTAPRLLAMPMLVVGLAVSAVGVALAGRRVGRTRYRPDRWTPPAFALAASGAVAALAVRLAGTGHPDVLHPEPGALPATTYLALLAMLVPLVALVFTRRPGLGAAAAPPGALRTTSGSEEVARARVA
jgi:energy-coupling factor transport system permease protein